MYKFFSFLSCAVCVGTCKRIPISVLKSGHFGRPLDLPDVWHPSIRPTCGASVGNIGDHGATHRAAIHLPAPRLEGSELVYYLPSLELPAGSIWLHVGGSKSHVPGSRLVVSVCRAPQSLPCRPAESGWPTAGGRALITDN